MFSNHLDLKIKYFFHITTLLLRHDLKRIVPVRFIIPAYISPTAGHRLPLGLKGLGHRPRLFNLKF